MKEHQTTSRLSWILPHLSKMFSIHLHFKKHPFGWFELFFGSSVGCHDTNHDTPSHFLSIESEQRCSQSVPQNRTCPARSQHTDWMGRGPRARGPGSFMGHKDLPDRSRAELVTPRHRPAEEMTAVILIIKRMQLWSGPHTPTPIGGAGTSGVLAGGRATNPRAIPVATWPTSGSSQ